MVADASCKPLMPTPNPLQPSPQRSLPFKWRKDWWVPRTPHVSYHREEDRGISWVATAEESLASQHPRSRKRPLVFLARALTSRVSWKRENKSKFRSSPVTLRDKDEITTWDYVTTLWRGICGPHLRIRRARSSSQSPTTPKLPSCTRALPPCNGVKSLVRMDGIWVIIHCIYIGPYCGVHHNQSKPFDRFSNPIQEMDPNGFSIQHKATVGSNLFNKKELDEWNNDDIVAF